MDDGSFYKIYAKVIIYVALAVILCIAFVSIRYYRAQDFPKCVHRKGIHDKDISQEGTSFCIDHEASPVDIGSLRTGDIMMVSYNDVRGVFSAMFYGSIWTHCGLIWVDPKTKEPYVLELSFYDPPYNSILVKIPFSTWAKIMNNAKAISILHVNRHVDATKLHSAFMKMHNSDIGIASVGPSWLRFYVKRTFNDLPSTSYFAPKERAVIRRDKLYPSYIPSTLINMIPHKTRRSLGFTACHTWMLTCHEVLIHLLQEVGVFSKACTPCSYIPHNLYQRSVPCIDGYAYSEPVEVSTHLMTGIMNMERTDKGSRNLDEVRIRDLKTRNMKDKGNQNLMNRDFNVHQEGSKDVFDEIPTSKTTKVD